MGIASKVVMIVSGNIVKTSELRRYRPLYKGQRICSQCGHYSEVSLYNVSGRASTVSLHWLATVLQIFK